MIGTVRGAFLVLSVLALLIVSVVFNEPHAPKAEASVPVHHITATHPRAVHKASVTSTTVKPKHKHKHKKAPPLVSPAVMAEWAKVATCETGSNWSMQGSMYSGGIGMMNSTWQAYGGTQFAPNAGLATPEQQVYIAVRIEAESGQAGYVPDQGGYCASW